MPVKESHFSVCYRRATQIRAEAENVNNPETKQALLRIADSYEQLAISVSKPQISSL